MKLSIDRIENGIAICQNLQTKEIIELDINSISATSHEGDIVIYQNNKYLLSNIDKKNRLKEIKEKLNRVKNIK